MSKNALEFILINLLFCMALILVCSALFLLFIAFYKIFRKQTTGTVAEISAFEKKLFVSHGDSGEYKNVLRRKAVIECLTDGKLQRFQTKLSYRKFIFKIFFTKGKKLKVAYKTKGKLRVFIYAEASAAFLTALLYYVLPMFAGYMLLVSLCVLL